MVRFVTINKFCDMTGYTRRAVEGKRQTGAWTEGGVIVKAPDGHILIDIEEFERWALSGQEPQKAPGRPMKSPMRPDFGPPPQRRKCSPRSPKLDT
ncbi:excisionase [Paraburkholderia domus]|uniref:excisionase n=1 Tax=Paraburkholderia domus TaxID=2793075 RepID=UPI001B04B812|nr:excisionase [Paraburkholderia domus]CAE6835335.1 hypothetical protein R75483_06891 [Paraburkholderia domus]